MRFTPSYQDVLLAGPRMLRKIGSFVSTAGGPESSIGELPLDPAHEVHLDTLRRLVGDPPLYETLDRQIQATRDWEATDMAQHTAVRSSGLSVDGVRGFGSVFSYATSRWAIACIAMAIILNRTHIYAATRRRLRLRWTARLLIRITPIILISVQAVRILQSLQCQTSPDFAQLRWNTGTKSSELMFAHPNRFFNGLATHILFASDEQSCRAVQMIPADDPSSSYDLRGSLSRLWPLFGSFCMSHFLETLSCAVQGRRHAYETAMTLFEQSLAFAEADAAVSNQLTWTKMAKLAPRASQATAGTTIALSRSMIMRRVNTPPEVLFVAFLSALTHISSHILGIFDLQAKCRLIHTGFWAFCFMATIMSSALAFDLDDPNSQGLLRYPTVCIIGLIPHMLVLLGIILCLFIYGLGVVLSALSPPPGEDHLPLTLRQRIARAHQNMQAVSFSDIRITREMDIYTALLRTGFAAVTMASEAVYLNEDRGVGLQRHTWLEEARLKEAEDLQRAWIGSGLGHDRYDQIGAIGLVPVKEGGAVTANGFSRERAAQKVPATQGERVLRVGGVGAGERSARWTMALGLFLNICKLFLRIGAITLLWILSIARIRAQPAALVRLARRQASKDGEKYGGARSEARAAPMRDGAGATMNAQDIESEITRQSEDQSPEAIDTSLYEYFLKGGWWGTQDESGDYQPDQVNDDWDTTSVISASTTSEHSDDETDWESDIDDGQRTPTQRSLHGDQAQPSLVDTPFSMTDLARLLQPQSAEERSHAQALVAHFQSDRIVTRSHFRRLEQLQRTRILTNPGSGMNHLGGNVGSATTSRHAKLTPEEEEHLLEQLLLSRRNGPTVSRDSSNAGLVGENGPQCVVCQCSPRSVIVWPCRCLSLCDECRIALAMNNFDKCVCCRREVMSFSRIFVP